MKRIKIKIKYNVHDFWLLLYMFTHVVIPFLFSEPTTTPTPGKRFWTEVEWRILAPLNSKFELLLMRAHIYSLSA